MVTNRYFQSQKVWTLILSIIVTLSIDQVYSHGMLEWLDSFIYDQHVSRRTSLPPPPNITLVLLDDKSSVELNRNRGTWSRQKLAIALQNLCDAEAEIVGLDMILSAPDPDPEIDSFLAETIYQCNNVVMGRISSAPGVGSIPPLPLFQEAMIGDGFLDFSPDSDEVLRKVRFLNAKPLEDGSLMLLPSFALEIARTFQNIAFEFDFSHNDFFLMGEKNDQQVKLPYPELIVNYTGNYQNFGNISFADVVTNRFAKEMVKGKIVLLGSSMLIQKDFFITPYTRFQKSRTDYNEAFGKIVAEAKQQKDLGVSCHAYAINTILNNSFISRASSGNIRLLIAITGLLGMVFYTPKLKVFPAAVAMVLMIVFLAGSAHFIFIRKLLWIDIAPLCVLVGCQFVSGTSVQRYFEKKRTERVTSLFGRYVSPEVVNQLVAEDIGSTLNGHRQELTIFFSDVRSFTTLAEELGAEKTADLLNSYFNVMIPVIFQNSGTLDKLIGDAVMAFFGAPVSVDNHPDKAASASLLTIAALNDFKKGEIAGADKINIGIGLNTGEVTIGNLGSDKFMDYTVIGDAVNLAARLEGLNKTYGTQILISEYTADKLSDRFCCRELDIVKVKGKDKPVKIFELFGYTEQIDKEISVAFKLFFEGLGAYRKMEWDLAQNHFEEVLAVFPNDGPAKLYLKRIAEMRQHPPQQGWVGVTKFETK